jgi:hypothetical protein
MRTLLLGSVAVWASALAAGCTPQYTQPASQPQHLSAAEKDFDAVWEASRQTLQKYYFQLDREDRRAGVITTAPMTGKQWFEFWRQDAVRPADVAESTLQTIHRTAQVTIRPTKAGAETYQAQVDVFLRRSDKPSPEVSSTSDAIRLFSDKRDRKQHHPEPLLASTGGTEGIDYTADLGHDRALEAKLSGDIAAATAKARGK